jgi:hypothetical protein
MPPRGKGQCTVALIRFVFPTGVGVDRSPRPRCLLKSATGWPDSKSQVGRTANVHPTRQTWMIDASFVPDYGPALWRGLWSRRSAEHCTTRKRPGSEDPG